MIAGIRGLLQAVRDEDVIVSTGFMDLSVLVSEFSRRKLQSEVGKNVAFYTLFYLDGNPTQGRITPRLAGFLSEFEREFFDLFCSVEKVGPKKALRAITHPVEEIAVAIKNQDTKFLATLPGIGPATAESIVAKLRRKVGAFAIASPADGDIGMSYNGVMEQGVLSDAYQALLALGHSEHEARRKLEAVAKSGETFQSVSEVINAVYRL
ncbi:MAG: Holliday junction branch migration protein RuvA [Planctomycetia bacterium]|nr:Holliday junction branch migration protein RuvA [Planctomycetia bacterium]